MKFMVYVLSKALPHAYVPPPIRLGAAAGEFRVGDFGHEVEIKVVCEAGVTGGIIEEIDDVPAEAVFEAAAFFEIEGAGGIDFDLSGLFKKRPEDALEQERSGANLCHSQSHDVVGHAN